MNAYHIAAATWEWEQVLLLPIWFAYPSGILMNQNPLVLQASFWSINIWTPTPPSPYLLLLLPAITQVILSRAFEGKELNFSECYTSASFVGTPAALGLEWRVFPLTLPPHSYHSGDRPNKSSRAGNGKRLWRRWTEEKGINFPMFLLNTDSMPTRIGGLKYEFLICLQSMPSS